MKKQMQWRITGAAAILALALSGFGPPQQAAPAKEQRQAQGTARATAGTAFYTNPVLAGDYPDPSVIRVGDVYWATATSSEWAPEYPLLRSTDLVNWEIAGTVFPQAPAWTAGNYWAPEIWHENGKFFVYYVARKKDGPLCSAVATASRPEGPYTDHGALVCQEVGSIDPYPIRDENGKLFMLWKEDGNSRNLPTPIWAQQLSEDGTRLVGERTEVLRNTTPWEKHLIEGPYVLRRDGWFYLFYSGNACCGRECNYALGVARSRKLLGPYEKNPNNPILPGNEQWKCPGHGTMVEGPEGRWYMMYHAYAADDFVYVGRQALVDEVVWGSDGWPTMNDGKGPSGRAVSPFGKPENNSEYHFADEFNGAELQPGWQWLAAHRPQITVSGGKLRMAPAAAVAQDIAGGIAARSTTKGDYVATAVLTLPNQGSAGIAAVGDLENLLGISVAADGAKVWTRAKNKTDIKGTAKLPKTQTLHVRMTARGGHHYRFSFSADGRRWKDVGGELDGAHLPPWDRGVRVGLIAGGAAGTTATFDSLRIEPSSGKKRSAGNKKLNKKMERQ